MKRILFIALLTGAIWANAEQAQLPPALPWHGESETLLKDVPVEWSTPAERSNFETTPNYEETLAYLRRLDRQSSLIQIQEFGRSAQDRPLVLVIASNSPEPLLSKRLNLPQTRILIQAGIHAGEIDGKDAGLMLLRDIALGKKSGLLNNVDLYFVPVFNVDGHERRGGHNRVNQRGPNEMGWRTTAQNLNLNRDYIKAEAVEMQAMLRLMQQLDPEVYIDIHVTDGIDYQYDITYGFNETYAASPRIAHWLRTQCQPAVDRGLKRAGHIPGPLIYAIDDKDMSKGMGDWHASPRYSQGYSDVRHIASVLVENHSLKSYKQRVLGTYVLIEEILKVCAGSSSQLRRAIQEDRARRRETIGFQHTLDTENARFVEFAGITHELYDSPVSGAKEIRWTGRPLSLTVPVIPSKPRVYATRPKAYWLDAGWREVVEVLKRHGIPYEEIREPVEKRMEFYRLPEAVIVNPNFEGRPLVQSGMPVVENMMHVFYPGSICISTDHALGELVVAMMEPQSEDSLFSWGYFLPILNATEYIEGYVVEPMAQKMLEQNPELKTAFEEALKEEIFANDPQARMQWFYERSSYRDRHHRLYPIGIER